MEESFDHVIKEHLDLKRRNSHLEATLPLANYQREPASVTAPTPGVFDAETEGAAFNSAEWNSDQWSETRRGRPKEESDVFLESLEDVSSGLDFNWDKSPRKKRLAG
jgi:hypothetical protein